MPATRPVTRHRPVLPREVVAGLELAVGQVVVDGTVGGGGHARLMLDRIGPAGTLVGLDRDPAMLERAAAVVSGPNVHLVHAGHGRMGKVLDELGLPPADRVLLDLGLSSDQLESSDRGFGFKTDGPLDMRFDVTTGRSAADWLADVTHEQLAAALRDHGELPDADRTAERILGARPVRTAGDLLAAVGGGPVEGSARGRGGRSHPATRVFQAIRIAVNGELERVEHTLAGPLWDALADGGRAAVLSFHSLEDRLVKRAFANDSRWRTVGSGVVTATPAEVRLNPRSRSAKLRVAVKLGAAGGSNRPR